MPNQGKSIPYNNSFMTFYRPFLDTIKPWFFFKSLSFHRLICVIIFICYRLAKWDWVPRIRAQRYHFFVTTGSTWLNHPLLTWASPLTSWTLRVSTGEDPAFRPASGNELGPYWPLQVSRHSKFYGGGALASCFKALPVFWLPSPTSFWQFIIQTRLLPKIGLPVTAPPKNNNGRGTKNNISFKNTKIWATRNWYFDYRRPAEVGLNCRNWRFFQHLNSPIL